MVASIGAVASPSQGAAYYERDGYYAKDSAEHRAASMWAGRGAAELGLELARLGAILPALEVEQVGNEAIGPAVEARRLSAEHLELLRRVVTKTVSVLATLAYPSRVCHVTDIAGCCHAMLGPTTACMLRAIVAWASIAVPPLKFSP